jgi:hypothetical protein
VMYCSAVTCKVCGKRGAAAPGQFCRKLQGQAPSVVSDHVVTHMHTMGTPENERRAAEYIDLYYTQLRSGHQ